MTTNTLINLLRKADPTGKHQVAAHCMNCSKSDTFLNIERATTFNNADESISIIDLPPKTVVILLNI